MGTPEESLTRHLMEREFGRKSPLEQRVERGITALANEIAGEVIAENPELRMVIARQTRAVIAAALRDDAYLSGIVAKAVAQGLTQLVRGDDA